MDHFQFLPDPRVDRTKEHRLTDILTIAIGAVIAGADSWVAVERFGHAKAAWLRTLLALPNGIPSHDTFGRVFAALDPGAFSTPISLVGRNSVAYCAVMRLLLIRRITLRSASLMRPTVNDPKVGSKLIGGKILSQGNRAMFIES